MKNLKLLVMAGIATVLLSSCGAFAGAPVYGGLYMEVEAPFTATDNTVGNKVGTGKATSYLGLIAMGDASINTAAKKAGITKISHVDYVSKNILGIVATWEIYVYGE